MADVDTQNIPSELLYLYEGALHPAAIYKGGKLVRKRYPWRMPHMQGDGRIRPEHPMGARVTMAQFEHRKLFRRSCDCFNMQDPTHDILDPPTGPKSRGYWFDQAITSGLWYYDYFIQQTLDIYLLGETPVYCQKLITGDSWVDTAAPDRGHGEEDEIFAQFSLTRSSWIYVTKNDPTTNIFHFFIQYMIWYPWIEGAKVTFDFWKVAGPIDEMGITWNNKPVLQEKIGTLEIPYDSDDTWHEIEIPNIKAFAITARGPSPLSNYEHGAQIASRESPPEWGEAPYWT